MTLRWTQNGWLPVSFGHGFLRIFLDRLMIDVPTKFQGAGNLLQVATLNRNGGFFCGCAPDRNAYQISYCFVKLALATECSSQGGTTEFIFRCHPWDTDQTYIFTWVVWTFECVKAIKTASGNFCSELFKIEIRLISSFLTPWLKWWSSCAGYN